MTPSGFEIEYGWGGRTIDVDNWTPRVVTGLRLTSANDAPDRDDSARADSQHADLPDRPSCDYGLSRSHVDARFGFRAA